jgi:hypothetical protein
VFLCDFQSYSPSQQTYFVELYKQPDVEKTLSSGSNVDLQAQSSVSTYLLENGYALLDITNKESLPIEFLEAENKARLARLNVWQYGDIVEAS